MRRLRERLHLVLLILSMPIILIVCALSGWIAIVVGSLREALEADDREEIKKVETSRDGSEKELATEKSVPKVS